MFRTMGCLEYNNLEVIFGGTTPTSRFSASLAQGIESPPRDEGNISTDPPVDETQQPSIGVDEPSNCDTDHILAISTKTPLRKRPSEFCETIVDQATSVDKKFDRLVEAINGLRTRVESPTSMSCVLVDVNTIKGLDHNDYVKIYEVFHNLDAREFFMNMPPTLRKSWVMSAMGH
uniref:Uncharacterized protein n=1 Tax=Nelumbo nucifera TaxID=4432 RepID=A0A822XDN8_NELNU|nr:TPA_asm: hypothetical protein HUJ06_019760 [Nelumbo nucifera]